AESDGDCKGSEGCSKEQRCSAYRGECVDLTRAIHAECAKSCGSEGLCVMRGTDCVALSRQHCAGTASGEPEKESACARLGLCTPKDGKCVAGTDQDCRGSELCKKEARCAARDG